MENQNKLEIAFNNGNLFNKSDFQSKNKNKTEINTKKKSNKTQKEKQQQQQKTKSNKHLHKVNTQFFVSTTLG